MTSSTTPRFTIIIPTKDRADYLVHTLRTCAGQDYELLEVIVSDDGSADHTREVVEEAARKDPRIRYVSPGRGVGMRDNFEFALDQVKPGYVMAMGGDDGLLPHAIQGMWDLLRETKQEMLAWPLPLFHYAGVRTASSQLILHAKWGLPRDDLRIIKSRDFLRNQVDHLQYVTDIESPMIYLKGVASTTIVDRVRKRSPGGRFYSCSTPDGYSGIVLAGEGRTWAFSGRPFAIAGSSPSSAGLNYLAANERAKAQSAAFFSTAESIPMHPELARQPYSPLVSLMTVDFLLTARDLPGWAGEVPEIDYRRVLERALQELADGNFAADRMPRELSILLAIARHHGLGEAFLAKVRGKRKNRRRPLEGNAVSPGALFLDATKLGLRDVEDAAHAAALLHAGASQFSFATLMRTVSTAVRHYARSFARGERFPPESAWRRSAEAD